MYVTPGATRSTAYEGDIQTKLETLKWSYLFAQLNENRLIGLAKLATWCHLRKGDFVFREGDRSDFFYFLKAGRIKLFKESICGKNFTISVLQPGDAVHSVVLFDDMPRWASAKAIDEVIAMRIGGEEFFAFASENPSVLIGLTNILAGEVQRAYDRIRDMVVDRVDQRLIKIINMLTCKFGMTLFFTAEEIAELAGTTTETTCRVLSRLKRSGVIGSSRRKIIVLDQPRLNMLRDDFRID